MDLKSIKLTTELGRNKNKRSEGTLSESRLSCCWLPALSATLISSTGRGRRRRSSSGSGSGRIRRTRRSDLNLALLPPTMNCMLTPRGACSRASPKLEPQRRTFDGQSSQSVFSANFQLDSSNTNGLLDSAIPKANRSRCARDTSFCVTLTASMVVVMVLLAIGGASSWFQAAEAIKLQPEGREKFYWSGEQFVITCQNNNNIKNVKIRWIGPNGMDITEDRSQRVHAESTGPHGHRLVVMNATALVDDGQYKCTLGSTDDRNPREHIEFNLKVYKATSFKDTARHLALVASERGTINCRVEFDPNVLTASVSWVRDAKPIEMYNDSSYIVSDYDPGKQLSQLTISPLTRQHDGNYTCRAVAVTSQLSKISDHDIRLETSYAPIFDQSSHIIWVERSQSIMSRQQHHADIYGPNAAGHQHQQQANRRNRYKQHQHPMLMMSSSQSAGQQGAGQRRHNEAEGAADESRQSATDTQLASSSQQQQQQQAPPAMVRVELRCTCQANPAASILWTSEASRFELRQGDHVLEDPQTIVDGHNSTSILVIGYKLDPNWEHKGETYICSASNRYGSASKKFNIEQGDPPPAFDVGPHRHYDPKSSLFQFTLLGPNFDPELGSGQRQRHQNQNQEPIVPAVDVFRIRAESGTGGDLKTSSGYQGIGPSTSSLSLRRPSAEPAHVLVMPPSAGATSQQTQPAPSSWISSSSPESTAPLFPTNANYTVSLSKLPSGNQRLFLEAHNAVGWSPNATYLGDYYIVSGSISSILLSGSSMIQWLALNMVGILILVNFQPL